MGMDYGGGFAHIGKLWSKCEFGIITCMRLCHTNLCNLLPKLPDLLLNLVTSTHGDTIDVQIYSCQSQICGPAVELKH